MSSESDDRRDGQVGQDGNGERSPDAAADADARGEGGQELVESRLEKLADEMAGLIESSAAQDRESLHDYAVSLVRDRLPVAAAVYDTDDPEAADSAEVDASSKRSSNAANLLGYGFLLVPVGFLLSIVFPFGLLLLVGGLFMIGAGFVMAMIGKLAPKRTVEGD